MKPKMMWILMAIGCLLGGVMSREMGYSSFSTWGETLITGIYGVVGAFILVGIGTFLIVTKPQD